MRLTTRILLTSALAVMLTLQALGETSADTVKVLFRMGYSQFDPSLGDNRAAMDRFIDLTASAWEQHRLDSIVVRGHASPDGISTSNQLLSLRRCENIARLIEQRAGVSPGLIRTVSEGVAWDEMREAVAADPDAPSREKILDIIDYVPVWVFGKNGKIIDGRKKQLMELDGGATYRWLQAHIFPQLRNAIAVSIYLSAATPEDLDRTGPVGLNEDFDIDLSAPSDTACRSKESIPVRPYISDETVIRETADSTAIMDSSEVLSVSDISSAPDLSPVPDISENSTRRRKHGPFRMALKTNMLFDAALVPNLGAEFYLGGNLSLCGEWMYAWWDNNHRHRFWRTYGGDLGLRWWFGRKAHANPLSGHHLGIYGGILTFDVEIGDKGYLGGKPGGTLWDRWLTVTGIEYGYSLPVGKRINIDFSIGFGYMGGNYIKYYPFDNDYYFDKEYRMRHFGPTKAEISLVWILGRINRSVEKGGEE